MNSLTDLQNMDSDLPHREVFDIDAFYFQELMGLLENRLTPDKELITYLNNEKRTGTILKLFLEDKDTFDNIEHMIHKKFYKNLFRCKEIFNDLSTNKIRKIKRRNSKTLKQLKNLIKDDNIIKHVLKNYLESESIILDSVLELTKDYVVIEKVIEYSVGYSYCTRRNRFRITDKLTGNTINSIYLNKHKKARLFKADPETEEYIYGELYAGKILKTKGDETNKLIEKLNLQISNSPFLYCICIRRLHRSMLCDLCGDDLLSGKCSNSYCVEYVIPEIVKCQQCKFWCNSWYE